MKSLFRGLATISLFLISVVSTSAQRSNFQQTCGYRMAQGERRP